APPTESPHEVERGKPVPCGALRPGPRGGPIALFRPELAVLAQRARDDGILGLDREARGRVVDRMISGQPAGWAAADQGREPVGDLIEILLAVEHRLFPLCEEDAGV